MDHDEILEGVKRCLLDCVRVTEDKIGLKSKLLADLGADSLDLLDVIFSLERAFKIKIKQGEIERLAREGIPPNEFEENGLLKAAGVARLREILSEVPPEDIREGMHTAQIPYLFTVETLVKIVQRSLTDKAKEGQAP